MATDRGHVEVVLIVNLIYKLFKLWREPTVMPQVLGTLEIKNFGYWQVPSKDAVITQFSLLAFLLWKHLLWLVLEAQRYNNKHTFKLFLLFPLLFFFKVLRQGGIWSCIYITLISYPEHRSYRLNAKVDVLIKRPTAKRSIYLLGLHVSKGNWLN